MIWRYTAIPIEVIKEPPSLWKRFINSIIFWRKTELPAEVASVEWMEYTSDITTSGLVEAVSEKHAIFKLMHADYLYPVELEEIADERERAVAKRLIRLQNFKNKAKKLRD